MATQLSIPARRKLPASDALAILHSSTHVWATKGKIINRFVLDAARMGSMREGRTEMTEAVSRTTAADVSRMSKLGAVAEQALTQLQAQALTQDAIPSHMPAAVPRSLRSALARPRPGAAAIPTAASTAWRHFAGSPVQRIAAFIVDLGRQPQPFSLHQHRQALQRGIGLLQDFLGGAAEQRLAQAPNDEVAMVLVHIRVLRHLLRGPARPEQGCHPGSNSPVRYRHPAFDWSQLYGAWRAIELSCPFVQETLCWRRLGPATTAQIHTLLERVLAVHCHGPAHCGDLAARQAEVH